MKEQRKQKGITLVALVVTIIVLLILAGVTIMTLFGENGLITMAQKAKSETENAQANAIAGIASLANEMNSILNEGGTGGGSSGGSTDEDNPSDVDFTKKVSNNLNKVITGQNADLTDSNGNKITVPVGFKIVTPAQDNTIVYDYLGDGAPAVQDGIVIQNESDENQFVWVPVGTINNKSGDTRGTTTTIKLGRYSNFTVTNGVLPIPAQEATVDGYNTQVPIETYYTERTESDLRNTTATNLQEWINTTLANGGYYIARYESSQNGSKAASTAGKTVWTEISQPDAAIASKATYPMDGTNKDNYYSDLMNSYAWDTAIVFIEAYADSSYASKNNISSFGTTGTNQDKVCNIHEMSGNAGEWTTESSTYSDGDGDCPYTVRGGYFLHNGRTNGYASFRAGSTGGVSFTSPSFRFILYVK